MLHGRSATRLPAATRLGAPAGYDPQPTPAGPVPAEPATVPFSYPPPTRLPGLSAAGPSAPPKAPGRLRSWLPVAAVAALIGGAIGAGVTAIADNQNSGNSVRRHHPRERRRARSGRAERQRHHSPARGQGDPRRGVDRRQVRLQRGPGHGDDHHLRRGGDHEQPRDRALHPGWEHRHPSPSPSTARPRPCPPRSIGYDQTKDVALLKINNTSNLPDRHFRQLVQGRGGRRRGRHRQRARPVGGHPDGDPGHRLGPRALGDRRRQRAPRPRRCRT